MTEARMRWTELEWYEVAREMIAIMDKQGIGLGPAAVLAQKRALPKARRRPETSLNGGARMTLRDLAERIKAGYRPEGASEPEAAAPPPAPAAPAAPSKAPGRVYWTDREWAMLACAVKHKMDNGDTTASLARLFFETQADVLPADRLRPISALYAAGLQTSYADAVKRIWTLPPDVRARLTGQEDKRAAHLEAARAGLAVLEAAQAIAAAPAVPAPSPAPIAAPAPLPAPSTHAPPAPLVQFPAAAPGDPLAARIALILGSAAAQISSATRDHVMAEYDRQLDRLVGALASSLREHVHGLIEAELGPIGQRSSAPASPPPPSTSSGRADPQPSSEPEPEPATAPSASPTLPGRMLVQIVGAPGPGRGMIRDSARALNIDAEFIDAERALRQWFPARQVILTVKDGRLRKAAQAAGAEICFATAGTASVVGMLEAIAQHGGGTLQ